MKEEKPIMANLGKHAYPQHDADWAEKQARKQVSETEDSLKKETPGYQPIRRKDIE